MIYKLPLGGSKQETEETKETKEFIYSKGVMRLFWKKAARSGASGILKKAREFNDRAWLSEVFEVRDSSFEKILSMSMSMIRAIPFLSTQ